jgi:NitT/TauT family transport system substrate-binding protein
LKKSILVIIVAMVVLLSLGCISSPENKPPTEKAMTLRIGYQPSNHQVAEMLAMNQGWWLRDLLPFGVASVKEFEFFAGKPEMEAMRNGNLDVAYVGIAPFISAVSQGLNAKIVAGVNNNGSDLVLKSGVKYDGPISLEGLTIATNPPGSIQDLVLRKWLRDNGIDADKIKIVTMAQGDAVTAISEGKVDGIFIAQPYPAMIEMAGKGKIVLSSGQMWPNHACCSLVVSGKLISEHPDLVEQIVRIHINATDYINANPGETARIYSNHTGLDQKIVEYSKKIEDGKWISDPNIQVPSAMEYARMAYQMNYTQREVTKDELFDTSFYERARRTK